MPVTSDSKPTVRHVVHIRLDPDLDPQVREALETDMRELVEVHPHAVSGRLHRDLGRKPASSVSATWMVELQFVSMNDFEAYLADPLHAAFIANHSPSMVYISAIQVPLE